jgi:hypothetical protein
MVKDRLMRMSEDPQRLWLAPMDGSSAHPRLPVLERVPEVGAGPFLIRLGMADAGETDLFQAAAAGATGVLLDGPAGWEAVERLASRLSVVEALADKPDGVLAIWVLAGPALLAAERVRPVVRLAGFGLDEAAFPAGATATARGLVLLGAAAMEVPAFIRLHDAANTRADRAGEGFVLALSDERRAA